MQRFTICDIENLCRIKAHTLRIWEQRYDFFAAKRKESQHRYYDGEDLQFLLQVAYLYHGGWKVSRIAALSRTALTEAVKAARQEGGAAGQEVISLLEAALRFDEVSFRDRLDHLVRRHGLERTILEVGFPYLQRLGQQWLTGHVIPAQEHFSSYLIQHKIIVETERLEQGPPRFPRIVLFTPSGEHHELPLLFLNYLFRFYGWAVLYLGTNVDLQRLPELVPSDVGHYHVHLLTNLTGLSADDYFESLCIAFPGKIISASGSGVLGLQRRFRNQHVLSGDAAILQFIRNGNLPEPTGGH